MNNFSEITAIDTAGQLTVELKTVVHGRCIHWTMLNEHTVESSQAVLKFDLFSPIVLKINLIWFKEGTSGVEIQSLKVNGLEIMPRYQHLASKSTNYIDQLGLWSLEIPSPFYTWYHGISGQGFIA